MTTVPEWRKSSRSGEQTDCVEVRQDLAAIRDSKSPASVLDVGINELLAAVKGGRIDV